MHDSVLPPASSWLRPGKLQDELLRQAVQTTEFRGKSPSGSSFDDKRARPRAAPPLFRAVRFEDRRARKAFPLTQSHVHVIV